MTHIRLICIFIHHVRHVLLWGYHATWRPELSILPQRPTDPVEPQWFGADLDSQLGRTPAVFLDQSETWQYVAGRISTKDKLGMILDILEWIAVHGHDVQGMSWYAYILCVYIILYYYLLYTYYNIYIYIIMVMIRSVSSGSDFLRSIVGDRSHQCAGGVGDFHEKHHCFGSGTPFTRLHHRWGHGWMGQTPGTLVIKDRWYSYTNGCLSSQPLGS